MITLLSALYNIAWILTLPFLRLSSRITLGWKQRTLKTTSEGPFDVWVQAASGGEALITNMLLRRLSETSLQGQQLRILVTSGTSQGIETLEKGKSEQPLSSQIDVHISYFPFDAPFLMKRAFARFSPAMAVVIETELWPGFLMAAKKRDVPVFIVNGRLTERSYRSYRYARSFFRKFGPEKVLAISPDDRDRFANLIGSENTALMNNIKFDRLPPVDSFSGNKALRKIITDQTPVIVFGSVRREEEEKIFSTIKQILTKKPESIITIFPKHIERSETWMNLLEQEGIPAVKRSLIRGLQPNGTVIVWDRFGELPDAYTIAWAAFVGGSLVNLGGQNFLEPLISGLRPCIGPYWKNFSWVGSDILSTGLVYQITDENELAEKLLSVLVKPNNRDNVIKQVETFFKPKRGGTNQACRTITDKLSSLKRR